MGNQDQIQSTSAVPYTAFSSREKRALTGILVLTMLASPLTATIYLPLLPLLAKQYDVSMQAVNVTITLYLVFQAISPLFFATASDTLGRRPIYLTTYTLYTIASLGLALTRHSYPALLILRALQSLGASAVLAVAFGVVADVCPPAERGSMLGPTQSAANLAVCLGPIVGGLVALKTSSSVWVFWSLTIFGGTVLAVVGLFLPETARGIVGNGNIEPKGYYRTWMSTFRYLARTKKGQSGVEANLEKTQNDGENQSQEQQIPPKSTKAKFKLANPWAACRIIFFKHTSLALWLAASPYAVWYIIQASIPLIYQDIYKFNGTQVGLAYLPGGLAVVLGGYANGKLMDWNYRKTAEDIGHTIDRVSGDNLDTFPIERARARGCWWLLIVYTIALASYGWLVVAKVHESVPLIVQFVLAVLCTCFQQTFNTLLVDIYPGSPSTAAASSNITRCALSALGVALLQPLVNAMGRGWTFTALSALSGGGGFAANWMLRSRGMAWRQQRLASSSCGEAG